MKTKTIDQSVDEVAEDAGVPIAPPARRFAPGGDERLQRALDKHSYEWKGTAPL